MPPKKTNAVSSVVSDLIRAAAGASARNVSDEDVDKYVADLILKEAEEKRKKYDQVGVKAYHPNTPPSNKPKPNTRFLLNMVKATDSHNQTVIRANEANVAKLRQDRLEKERQQREEAKKKDDQRRKSRHHHKGSSKYKSERSPERASHSSSSSSSSSSKHKRHRSKSPSRREKKKQRQETATEQVQFKGRGKVKINSSMDRYFSKGYDPLFDVESDKEDDYIFAPDDDKKNEGKSSETDSDSSSEIGPKPPAMRAWDVGKN